MLRVICLGRLTDPAAAERVVSAARRLIEEDPNVIAGEAAVGLRLMEEAVQHAHYSWIFDFEDEAGWHRYIEGAPHRQFAAVVDPVYESAVITQYDLTDAVDSNVTGDTLPGRRR